MILAVEHRGHKYSLPCVYLAAKRECRWSDKLITVLKKSESLSVPHRTGFRRMMLAEFLRKGTEAIGFVTKELCDEPVKDCSLS